MKLNSLEAALKVNTVIKDMVTKEIDRQRPAGRYAIVDSINKDERYVMAHFIGETDSVRIPCLDVMPFTTGQEVLVSGVAGDRAVTAIRGNSDIEGRLAALEAAVEAMTPAFGQWYREVDVTLTTGLSTMVWTGTSFPPYNFTGLATSGTEIVIPTTGYYEVTAEITASAGIEKDVYIQVLPISGGANYDLAQLGWKITAQDLVVSDLTIALTPKMHHFFAGDKIRMNIGVAGNLTLFGAGRTFWGIRRIITSELIGA